MKEYKGTKAKNLFQYIKRVFNAILNKPTLDVLYYNQNSINHLRDMIHNLPFFLNLDKKDTDFLAEVFVFLEKSLFHRNFWLYDINIEHIQHIQKYVGVQGGISVKDDITQEDIENAKQKETEALLKIAKAILFHNRNKYTNGKQWFDETVDFNISQGFKAFYDVNLIDHIKPEDQDMVKAILSYSYFDDNAVKYLLEIYKDRNIKTIINIFLFNQNKQTRVSLSDDVLEMLKE